MLFFSILIVDGEIYEDQWGKYRLLTLPDGRRQVQPIIEEAKSMLYNRENQYNFNEDRLPSDMLDTNSPSLLSTQNYLGILKIRPIHENEDIEDALLPQSEKKLEEKICSNIRRASKGLPKSNLKTSSVETKQQGNSSSKTGGRYSMVWVSSI